MGYTVFPAKFLELLMILFNLFGPDDIIQNGRRHLPMARDTLLPLIMVMKTKQNQGTLYCDLRDN